MRGEVGQLAVRYDDEKHDGSADSGGSISSALVALTSKTSLAMVVKSMHNKERLLDYGVSEHKIGDATGLNEYRGMSRTSSRKLIVPGGA